MLQEQHDSKIEYHCTGATLINDQPSDFEGLIAAARSYAQKNQGDKLQAILWPFSALDSYNRAEQLYSGARMPWSQQGRQLLKQLNLEHSRLQRLEHTIAMQKGLANSVAKKKVSTIHVCQLASLFVRYMCELIVTICFVFKLYEMQLMQLSACDVFKTFMLV